MTAARNNRLLIRQKGLVDYTACWQDMQTFTDERNESTPDECWIVQHPPVFTQGMAGKAEHILGATQIPIVHTDRGGQVTYHGPGQLVAYTLFDLRRRDGGVKNLVTALEQVIIDTLADFDISGERVANAPGVYVNTKKIAALGLRVRRGCSYHGLSLNVDMDLSPFEQINPCGYAGLQVTQMSAESTISAIADVENQLIQHLLKLSQNLFP